MPIQNWATISTKIELLHALVKLKRQARVNEEIKDISKPRKGDQNPARVRRSLMKRLASRLNRAVELYTAQMSSFNRSIRKRDSQLVWASDNSPFRYIEAS